MTAPKRARDTNGLAKPLADGVTDKLWEIGDIAKLVEDAEEMPKKRGPYEEAND